jgi:hypothetical protein
MSLGKKLRAIIQSEAFMKAEAEQRLREAEEKRRAGLRKARRMLVERIMEAFVCQIKGGRLPYYKIVDRDQQTWLDDWHADDLWQTRSQTSHDNDIWSSFISWLEKEDLVVKVTEDHDGVGINSWLIISAVPC